MRCCGPTQGGGLGRTRDRALQARPLPLNRNVRLFPKRTLVPAKFSEIQRQLTARSRHRKPRHEGGALSLIEIRLFLLGLAYAAEVVETNPIDIVARYIQFSICVDGEYPGGLIKEMSPVAFIRNVVLSAYISIRFALFNFDVLVFA